MLPEISKIKGVFPGAVLRRELKKRGLESKQFALSLGEYPQTINAINRGRRGITPALSIKLGEKLGANAEYFMLLQAYYEVEKKKQELLINQAKPNVAKFQKALFWDTNIDKIDWQRHKNFVVNRVFERGNEEQINEIISFYGEELVKQIVPTLSYYLPTFTENARRFLNIEL